MTTDREKGLFDRVEALEKELREVEAENHALNVSNERLKRRADAVHVVPVEVWFTTPEQVEVERRLKARIAELEKNQQVREARVTELEALCATRGHEAAGYRGAAQFLERDRDRAKRTLDLARKAWDVERAEMAHRSRETYMECVKLNSHLMEIRGWLEKRAGQSLPATVDGLLAEMDRALARWGF